MTRTSVRTALSTAGLMFAAMLTPVDVADAQTVDYRVSLGYATGSYIFSGTTWSAAMFHGLDVRAGRFTFSASVPVVAQNNTALTYIGGVIVPTGGPDGAAVAERRNGQPVQMGPGTGTGRGANGGMGAGNGRGNVVPIARATTTADTLTETQPGGTSVNVGDPLFSASAELYSGFGALRAVSVHLFAKAPVASVASGVSTGQWDFGGGASVSLGAGRTFFFADASYWALGNMPELELLDNVVYGLGVGRTSADARWSVLVSASGSSPVIRNVKPPASAGVSVGFRPGTAQSFTVGLNFGLTESSAKVSSTLGWRIRAF